MCIWFGFNPVLNFCHFSTLLPSLFFSFCDINFTEVRSIFSINFSFSDRINMEERTLDDCLDLCVIEDNDLYIQKCHMAPELMAKLQNGHAMVGEFVKFMSNNQSFICSVWPKTHLDENIVRVNQCVQFRESLDRCTVEQIRWYLVIIM